MKKITAFLLALAMVLSLAACGSSSSGSSSSSSSGTSTSGSDSSSADSSSSDSSSDGDATALSSEPVYGGSLTVSWPQLMSFYSQEAPDFANYMFWYEGLFAPDWSLDTDFRCETATERTGQLADSWEVDEENCRIIVYLREDVYFQQLDEEYDYYGGRNLVAEDVKWSYDRLLGTGSGFDTPIESMVDWASLFYMVDSIETEGDYTVIFNCNNVSEVTVDDFIVSSCYVHVIGPEYGDLTDEQIDDWHYACGTGPYIIEDCVDGSYITFKRNDNYYDYDERYPENKLPYLDELTLVLVSDTATLLSNFIAGEIDIVGSNNGTVFSDSEIAQIASTVSEDDYFVVTKNANVYSIAMKQTFEPFSSLEVRQAMQYAIDLGSICYDLYGYDELSICGYFTGETGWDVDWTDEEMWDSYTTYDPELAKEMLAEAGYADGFEFNLVYDSAYDADIYLIVQEYLSQVGITMNLVPLAESSERQALFADPDNNYMAVCELGTAGFSNGLNKIDSTNPNYMFGKEDTLDEMVANIRAQTTEAGQAEAALELNQYFMEQHYGVIFSPQIQLKYFARSTVGGLTIENLYDTQNGGLMLARVWNVNGAD